MDKEILQKRAEEAPNTESEQKSGALDARAAAPSADADERIFGAEENPAEAKGETKVEKGEDRPSSEGDSVSAPSVSDGETDGAGESSNDSDEDSEPERVPFLARCKERLTTWKNALREAVSARSAEVKHAKLKRIFVFVAIGLVIVFFIAFYFAVGKKIALFINDAEAFREWLEGFGSSAIFIFICLRVVQIVLKLIPGEALEIAAGCMFGAWEGLLWCTVGGIIGSFIIVFLGRKYGMKIVGLFVSPEKMRSVTFLKDKKRLNFTFFLLYFIPGTPKDVFTWLASLTDENLVVFVLLTNIARIPSVITSTWCGQELVKENYLLSAAILGATILIGVIGGLIYKLTLKKKKKELRGKKEA